MYFYLTKRPVSSNSIEYGDMMNLPHSGSTTGILLVPGWNGSGPGHWQRIWQSRFPHAQVLEQNDWEQPKLDDWLEKLERAVRDSLRPLILVGHSLGSSLIAHWSNRSRYVDRVRGALLVAPPWLDHSASLPPQLRDFAPVPPKELRFPSWLVASKNDPYLPLPLARCLARSCGSKFVDAGPAGHINVASGHGEWPQGEFLLREALKVSLIRDATLAAYA
jgi:uncharacterized protein